jgi:hypothetical protein
VKYAITAPNWLTASPKSGTLTTSPTSVTITLNSAARNLTPNTYMGTVSFTQTTNGAGNTSREATLTVNPKDYKLTVNASPASDGTVSGGGEIPEGSQTTVTATANSGFHFTQWTEAGKQVSTSSTYLFTMPSRAITVIADFQKN